MAATPPWTETFLEELSGFIELQSPGSLEYRYSDVEGTLSVAPGVVELVGGSVDGDEVFCYYSLDISELIGVFDKLPVRSRY